jgi:hypothetical protein
MSMTTVFTSTDERQHLRCFEKQVARLDRKRMGRIDSRRTAFSRCPDDCFPRDAWRTKRVYHASGYKRHTSIADGCEPLPHDHPENMNNDRMSNRQKNSFRSLRRNLCSKSPNNCHRHFVLCRSIEMLVRRFSSHFAVLLRLSIGWSALSRLSSIARLHRRFEREEKENLGDCRKATDQFIQKRFSIKQTKSIDCLEQSKQRREVSVSHTHAVFSRELFRLCFFSRAENE